MNSNRFVYIIPVILLLVTYACKNNKHTGTGELDGIQDSVVLSLTEKIADKPDNAQLYYERGRALHGLSMDSMALNDFQKAVSLDSGKAEYYSAVGDLLFEHKDISGSVSWLEKAIKLNPQDPQARMKIAKMFIYLKDFTKAFTEINIVLRQDVYNPEGYFLKGMIYKELNDTSKSISSFQTAVQVAPNYREAITQLGLMYSGKKDPLALQYFDRAFKLDSSDVFPLFAKGMYYQQQNEMEQAKEEYKNAIVHDRQYANAFFNIGYILLQQDSLDKAWRQFDLVTKIQPDDAQAYYNRGLSSELMGKKDDALADYKQALTFDPEHPEAQQGVKRLEKK